MLNVLIAYFRIVALGISFFTCVAHSTTFKCQSRFKFETCTCVNHANRVRIIELPALVCLQGILEKEIINASMDGNSASGCWYDS